MPITDYCGMAKLEQRLSYLQASNYLSCFQSKRNLVKINIDIFLNIMNNHYLCLLADYIPFLDITTFCLSQS